MSFVNTPFPDCIAFGAQSDPMWSTNIPVSAGGFEKANQNWEEVRHAYDVSFAVRTASEYKLIRTHFNEIRGRANHYPFKDYLDFEVSTSEGRLLSAAGAAPAADGSFQLHKRYGSTNAYDRKITRPDSPIAVWRTRSAVTTNIVGAGAAVTYTTGVVAITGHVGGDTYSWSGTFKVPVRYDTDRLPAAIINRHNAEELLVDCSSIPLVEVRE
jgi:uncharacterized protein (TIGR02217 family)